MFTKAVHKGTLKRVLLSHIKQEKYPNSEQKPTCESHWGNILIEFQACGHLPLGVCLSAGDRLQAPWQKEPRGGVVAMGARNICSDKRQPSSDTVAPSAPTRDCSWRTAWWMMRAAGCDGDKCCKGPVFFYAWDSGGCSSPVSNEVICYNGNLAINGELTTVVVDIVVWHHYVAQSLEWDKLV